MAAAMARGARAKRTLIQAHPDLAGKLALAKQLTKESTHDRRAPGSTG